MEIRFDRWATLALCLLCCLGAGTARAQERTLKLEAAETLKDSGFLQHILPRFALKHGIRVGLGTPGDLRLSATGDTPVFIGMGQVWHLEQLSTSPQAERFADWLRSDIGLRTVEGFTGPDGQPFERTTGPEVAEAPLVLTGDAAAGLLLSRRLCGRCHVVSEADRMQGIGSTPSFFALRSFSDWDERFLAFYVLNPHPSFTRISDLGMQLNPQHKAAIVPLDLSLDDLDDIVTYVADLPAADLGAPIQHQ